MKKSLLVFSLTFLFPLISYATISVPWLATSTDPGYIQPNPVNGNNPFLKILSISTSTFTNGINLTTGCFSVGGTCITSGSGGSGAATTSFSATYPIKLTLSSSAINYSLLDMATTSVTCTGSITCSSFTVLGSSPITISSTAGSGNVSTSTGETAGQLAYWTSTNATPALLGKVATSAPTVTAPITYSGTLGSFVGGATGTFGCTTSSAGVTGCLSGTDWTTFNNKQSALSLPLSIANGGTATTTQVTNAVNYFDGTRITGNPALLSFTGTNFGIATSSPYSILSAVGTTTIYGKYAHFGSVVCNASLYNVGDGFEFCGSSNADTQGSQIQVSNNNAGTAAFSGFTLNNNESDTSFLHFAGLYLNSSTYTSTGFGTAFANKRQALLQNTDGLLSLISSTSSTALNDAGINFITGGTATANERMRITTLGDVGIGTTTPAGTLGITTRSTDTYGMVLADRYNTPVVQVQTASTTGPIFQIQATSTADTLFQVDQYGHLTASSTPKQPTVSCTPSGGTISANSNDVTGDITTGTLSTACTVTLGAAYSAIPEVFLQQSGVASILGISARSTTAFTISLGTAATGDAISYFVVMP